MLSSGCRYECHTRPSSPRRPRSGTLTVWTRACACVALIIKLVLAPPALAAPAASSPLGDALDLLQSVLDGDGTPYPALVRSLGLTFDFVPLPTIFYGAYQRRARRVLLNSRLLDE